jgi:hypothetical protein
VCSGQFYSEKEIEMAYSDMHAATYVGRFAIQCYIVPAKRPAGSPAPVIVGFPRKMILFTLDNSI